MKKRLYWIISISVPSLPVEPIMARTAHFAGLQLIHLFVGEHWNVVCSAPLNSQRKPYKRAGFSTRILLRVATSGAQTESRFSRRPSSIRRNGVT
jgi:hypothetical protein